MSEEQIRAACEAANCKYPDMEIMAEFKREVTPAVVIGLLDGLRHAKGIAAINDARANGAAETIQHLRSDNTDLRARLAKYEDAEGRALRAKVRMPPRMYDEPDAESPEFARGHNAALEYVARLNSSPVSAGDDRKLSDIGNELHNLSCHVVHHNEGWANQLGTLASELWSWQARAQVSQGGEAVEVVAHMYQHDETGLVGFVDQQQVDWGFEKNNPRLHLCGELMTVAQHQRIMAASVGSAEPVAWMHSRSGAVATAATKSAMEDGSIPSGYDVPLYTNPADQVADGVVVSRELLLEISKSEGRGVDWAQEIDAALSTKP